MKIFYSALSPFARKCMLVAEELNLSDKIEKLASAANPVNRDQNILKHNPLAQVPTFFTDDGEVLFDSKVICEYLNEQGGGNLFGSGPQRWKILTEHAAADGVMAAAILVRYEKLMRPAELQWSEWTAGQMDKISTGLQYFEDRVDTLAERVDIATLTLGAALGYIDVRIADYDWRSNFPGLRDWFALFSERDSMKKTVPKL